MEKKKYLLIGLAIIILMALGLLMVVIWTTYTTNYPTISPIATDRSICAANEIQLLNYKEQYPTMADASGKLEIKYNRSKIICQQGQAEGEAGCPIGLKDSDECMGIVVKEDKCYITGLAQCA